MSAPTPPAKHVTAARLASRAAAFATIAKELLDLAELAHPSKRPGLLAARMHVCAALHALQGVRRRKRAG